jgi:competence protein ComEA
VTYNKRHQFHHKDAAMDAAPPTNAARPAPASPLPPVSAVWPRSARWATAFLLGLAAALFVTQIVSRWNTQPLVLIPGQSSAYRVDLNRASHEQLVQVPGIGDRTAEKIEAFRRDNGPFKKAEDITQVRGIGRATYEKMSEWVTVRPDNPGTEFDSAEMSLKQRRASPKESTTRKPSKKEENLRGLIDVNHAEARELQQLPGIGPKLAQRILDERAKGPFRSVEDLRRVSGIGPKILERLRPYVSVRSNSERIASSPANLNK